MKRKKPLTQPARRRQILKRYSEGRLTRSETIGRVGLANYAQLLRALDAAGISPPRLPPEQEKAMMASFLRLMDRLHRAGKRANRKPAAKHRRTCGQS